MPTSGYPLYSDDLIEWLDKQYPPRCIQKGESLEDAHRYAGRRDLIDELLAHKRARDRKAEKEAAKHQVK